MKDDLDFSPERCNWHVISKAEKCFPEFNAQVLLRTPHGWYRLTPTEKVAIRVYFRNLLGLAVLLRLIAKYIPDRVEVGENPLQRGYGMCPESLDTHHNASFARVSP